MGGVPCDNLGTKYKINLYINCLSLSDALFGSWKTPSKEKKNFNLPQPKMANTDLSRLLKSEEIRKVLRAPKYVYYILLVGQNAYNTM
jgi:hypothetical protein